MAIKKITLSEYKRIMRNRSMELGSRSRDQISTTMWPGMYFKAADGHYYVQDDVSPKGCKEVANFHRKLKREREAQNSLF